MTVVWVRIKVRASYAPRSASLSFFLSLSLFHSFSFSISLSLSLSFLSVSHLCLSSELLTSKGDDAIIMQRDRTKPTLEPRIPQNSREFHLLRRPWWGWSRSRTMPQDTPLATSARRLRGWVYCLRGEWRSASTTAWPARPEWTPTDLWGSAG